MNEGEVTIISLLSAALAGGLITGFVNYSKSQRARRRRIIAEAVEIAFDRVEILHKIRRRPIEPGMLTQDEISIRNEMHRIQSKTEYYITILSSESVWLGSCYEKLINEIKTQTTPLINEAWNQKPQGVSVELKNVLNPDLDKARQEFILETQRYFNPIKRLFFASIFRLWRLIHRG